MISAKEEDDNHLAVDFILGINEVAHVLARLLACPGMASFGLPECRRMSFHEVEAIKISWNWISSTGDRQC